MDYKYTPLRNWLLERDALSIRKSEKHYESLLKELAKYGFHQD